MDVRLSDYAEDWTKSFENEVEALSVLLGDEIIRFEHFGSTAVPGLKAKPVVDMMAIVKEINRIDTYSERMSMHDYDVAGEWGIPGRRLFRKGGDQRTHHIHMYQWDHPEIKRHLVVRDYLRAHPEEVLAYSQFKTSLVKTFAQTREYSRAKKPYVEDLEKRALIWASDQNSPF